MIIPGLLGEGNVLGVSIEGHRFASEKSQCSLLWTHTNSLNIIFINYSGKPSVVSFMANQFEGGKLYGRASDKSEVEWTGGLKAILRPRGALMPLWELCSLPER